MECPLCLLGFPTPHSAEDWQKLTDYPEVSALYEELVQKRLKDRERR